MGANQSINVRLRGKEPGDKAKDLIHYSQADNN